MAAIGGRRRDLSRAPRKCGPVCDSGFRSARLSFSVLVAAVLATMALLSAAATAAGAPAKIVYQCGSAICAVDPTGGTPTQLAQSGELAGVTRDGVTYGYAAPSSVPGQVGLWEAPVAGGTPTEINSGAVATSVDPPTPVMSPDGQFVLEHEEQFASGFRSDEDNILLFSLAAGPTADPVTVAASTIFGMTYGWLGGTTMTTQPMGTGLQPPSWVCIGFRPGASEFCPSTDPTAKIYSQTSIVAAPDGSPDGSQVVASLGGPGSSGGQVVIFSASTGAQLSTVASPPAGTVYYDPHFSPDGTQIVFEADPAGGGASSIDVVNVNGTGLTSIAQGSRPFWGGTGSPAPGPGPQPGPGPVVLPAAPKVKLTVPAQSLAKARKARRLDVTCQLAAAGKCTVTATIAKADARKLGLKVGNKAKAYPLARAATTFKKAGTMALHLRLRPQAVKALGKADRLKVKLTAISSAIGHQPRTATRTITLR